MTTIFKNDIHNIIQNISKERGNSEFMICNNEQYSYCDLENMSNNMASVLISKGVTDKSTVAIEVKEGGLFIVSIIAIMKVGAKYLLLTPFNTIALNEILINNNNIRTILVNDINENNYNNSKCDVVAISECFTQYDINVKYAENEINDIISLISEPTSINSVKNKYISYNQMIDWINFNINNLHVDFSSSLFIVSHQTLMNFPIWMANFLTGGKIIITYKKEIEDIVMILRKHNVKSLICSLDDLHELTKKDLFKKENYQSIKNVLTLGDGEYNFDEFKIFNKENGKKWYNYFGFPEVEIISTIIDDNLEQGKKIHVGKPVVGSDFLILNKSKQRCSINTKGDLYTSKYGIISESNIHKEKIKDQFLFETDYVGFIGENGFLNLNTSLKEKIIIQGFCLNFSFIEALFGACEIIQEFFVNIKNESLIIYFVQKEGFSLELLHKYLSTYLPIDINLIAFVELPFIPYCAEGNVNKHLLESKQYIDTNKIVNIENEIRRDIEEINEICIIAKTSCNTLDNFHISDFEILSNKKTNKEKDNNIKIFDQDLNLPDAIIEGDEEIQHNESLTVLPELLYEACEKYGNQELILIDSEGERKCMSYNDLYSKACVVAAGFKEKKLYPGEKVMILLEDLEDYFTAFWGCQIAGLIAVPFGVPKVIEDNNETKTLNNIWEMLDCPYFISTNIIKEKLLKLNSKFKIIPIEKLNDFQAVDSWYKSKPNDTAIIFFTSGSTGLPKGVTQSHKNIISRLFSAVDAHNLCSNDISMGWMPVEHVGGLLMSHVEEVAAGCKQIHVKTTYILEDILRWFDIISEYKATLSWAPNFAYNLAKIALENNVDKDWDLSSLRVLINAGEVVNAETSKKLLNILKIYNLSPKSMKPEWGMSETCSAVLGSDSFNSSNDEGIIKIKTSSLTSILEKTDDDVDSMTYVSLGGPFKGSSFRIVDEKNNILTSRIIGKMQIRGNTVTPSYYKNEAENNKVFVGDKWFDTGDLAFIYDDNIYFAGRTKDIIIINGINYNNTEIEATIEELDQIEASYTIASVVNNGEEKLAIFYCSKLNVFDDIIKQIKNIKAYVTEKVGVTPDYIIPVLKQDIPKTSIGKLQRAKIVKFFEEGKFKNIIKKIDLYLNINVVPSWFYKLDWQRKNLPIIQNNTIKNCIIFIDEEGLYPILLLELERRNYNNCIFVSDEKQFKRNDRFSYNINYNNSDQYNELFESLKNDNIAIQDIFYLKFYNKYSESKLDLNSKNDSEKELFLLQKLVKSLKCNINQSIRLVIPTNNLNSLLTADKIDYKKGWLSGFVKTLDIEEALIKPILLDIENNNNENNAKIIVNEILASTESEVVYRNNLRYVAKLSQIDMNSIDKVQLPVINNAVYMITGALGGIGMIISEWLLKEWKVKLILVGRSNIFKDDNAKTKCQNYLKLKSISEDIVYLYGDISDASFIKSCGKEVNKIWNRDIEGVFHLAGIGAVQEHLENIEAHNISFENEEYYKTLFKPKVNGTIALFNLLKDNKDSLFVGFSSVLSFFGGSTFSAYSSANGMLDTLCKYRLKLGYNNTFCHNWSSWKDIGMSKNTTSSLTSSSGYDQIEKENGVNSLILSLSTRINGLLIGLNNSFPNVSRFCHLSEMANQDLNVFFEKSNKETIENKIIENKIVDIVLKYIKSSNYLLKQIPIDQIPMLKSGKVDRDYLFKFEVKNKSEDNYISPRNEVEIKLVSIWSNVFNIDKEKISINLNFFEIGGNSLLAINLSSKIYKEFNVKIPLMEVFKHQTIEALSLVIKSSSEEKYYSIEKADIKPYYNLSSAQKRIYLLQQFDLESTVYNIPYVIQLGKESDKEKIEKVFQKLINRHESFRTRFETQGEELVQKIEKAVAFKVEKYKIEKSEVENTRNKFIRAFDLSQAPLLRVAIVEIKEKASLLMIDMHHIISDGTSYDILEREFQTLYTGGALPELNFQYKDYSEWQNSPEQQKKIKKQEDYWLRKYSDDIPIVDIPMDYARPIMQSYEGATVSFALSKDETESIKSLAKENGLTLYMGILSVYTILLSKLSGQEDIVIGSPIAGRNHPDLENVVGMFVNTLAIRNEVKGDETIKEFISKLKQTTLGSFENQDYQFEDLVEKVSVERDISRNPLFDNMFNLLNQTEHSGDLSGNDFANYVHNPGISKFDLTLTGVDYGDQLLFTLMYCTKLFKPESIERYIGYFKQIVSQLAENIDSELSTIDMLSSEEKHVILHEFNNTKTNDSKEKTIFQLFDEQVCQAPDRTAVVYNNQCISYSELNLRSHQLAQLLISKGLNTGDVVGIIVDRSIEMIIGILGVLKSGGVYLPLDIESPKERIKYIIKDSGLKIILSQVSAYKDIKFEGELLNLFDPSFYLNNQDQNINQCTASDAAYIIYTSGSTGKPKGVIVNHGNIVNLVHGLNKSIYDDYQEILHVSLISPIFFDASVKQIFPCLSLGHSLHIIPEYIRFEGSRLFSHYIKYDIQIADGTPFHAQMLLQYENEKTQRLNIRQFVLGGDELKHELMKGLFQKLDIQNLKISNVYGPTECTDVTTIDTNTKESLNQNGRASIGKPISNCEIYILGKENQVQAIGVPGELCISGEGLAQGYLNNPELTFEKFIEHPFKEGARLYRTGDLVRWLPDGNIEFLGRIDSQVKIRGFRIELGEIENVLQKHESIKESVVLSREANGDKYLCAYIVTKEEFNQEEIRNYLSATLPDYMIPSYFVELDKIPLTTNGKVNRKVLPSPEVKAGDDYVSPSTETEEKLVEIWSGVLNIVKEEISVRANFFTLGGHSLKAVILTTRIHGLFNVNITLKEIFRYPSIIGIANLIIASKLNRIEEEIEDVDYDNVRI